MSVWEEIRELEDEKRLFLHNRKRIRARIESLKEIESSIIRQINDLDKKIEKIRGAHGGTKPTDR